MRRITKYVPKSPKLYEPRTVLTVGQILKQYLTNGQIPTAQNVRPYDFAVGEDGKPDFDGDFSRPQRIDLFKTVSRESREAAAKKAALSTGPGSQLSGSADPSSSVSPTEGAGSSADGAHAE